MAERAVCVSGVCGGVFGSERVVVCMCVNFLCVSVCRCVSVWCVCELCVCEMCVCV